MTRFESFGILFLALVTTPSVRCGPVSSLSARNETSDTSNGIAFNTNVLRGWNIFESKHQDLKLTMVVAENHNFKIAVSDPEDFEKLTLRYITNLEHCDQKAADDWGDWEDPDCRPGWSGTSWFKPQTLRITAKEAIALGQQSRFRTEKVTHMVIRPPDRNYLTEVEVPIYHITYERSGIVFVNGITGQVYRRPAQGGLHPAIATNSSDAADTQPASS